MLPDWFFPVFPIILLLLGLLLFWLTGKIKGRTGLPDGKIIYADPGKWKKPDKPLYDSNLGLTGRPDYLIRRKKTIIPVEIKSNWAPTAPYESHKLQLAAYCLLVQSFYGKRPPYGLLRYRNRTFRINFSTQLEEQVLDILDEIRQQKEQDEVFRSHNQKNRCLRCGFRYICNQRL